MSFIRFVQAGYYYDYTTFRHSVNSLNVTHNIRFSIHVNRDNYGYNQ